MSDGNPPLIHLWPGKVPLAGKGEEKAPPEWRGGKPSSNCVKRITDPALEVFPAPKEKRNGLGVVVCPGGGYSILSIKKEGRAIAKWLNSLGITAFVLRYRVPGNRDAAFADALRAYRVVRADASKWGVSPEKIGFIGFSAGGHLSARVCCSTDKEKSSAYQPVDAADSAPVHPAFAMLIYPAYLDKGSGGSLSRELKILDATPPLFVFATADDPYSGSLLAIAAAARSAKKSVEAHLYPKGGHGYGLASFAGRQWPLLAADWLRRIFPKLKIQDRSK